MIGKTNASDFRNEALGVGFKTVINANQGKILQNKYGRDQDHTLAEFDAKNRL